MSLLNSNSMSDTACTQTNLEAIQAWMVNQLAQQLSVAPNSIQVTEPLTRYGLDSIDSVTLVGDLEEWLNLELPSTLLWDYPTIQQAATYLVTEFNVAIAPSETVRPISEAVAEAVTPEAVLEAQIAPNSAPASKGWGNIWGRISAS